MMSFKGLEDLPTPNYFSNQPVLIFSLSGSQFFALHYMGDKAYYRYAYS